MIPPKVFSNPFCQIIGHCAMTEQHSLYSCIAHWIWVHSHSHSRGLTNEIHSGRDPPVYASHVKKTTVMLDLFISRRCCFWHILCTQLLMTRNAHRLWARLPQTFYILIVILLLIVFSFSFSCGERTNIVWNELVVVKGSNGFDWLCSQFQTVYILVQINWTIIVFTFDNMCNFFSN